MAEVREFADEIDMLMKSIAYDEKLSDAHLKYEDGDAIDDIITNRLDYKGFDFTVYKDWEGEFYAMRLIPVASYYKKMPTDCDSKYVVLHLTQKDSHIQFWRSLEELYERLNNDEIFVTD